MRFDDEYKNAVESDKLSDDFIKELSIKMTQRARDVKNGIIIPDKTVDKSKRHSLFNSNKEPEEITTKIITYHGNRYNIGKTASLAASFVIAFTLFGTMLSNETKKNNNRKQAEHTTKATTEYTPVITDTVTVTEQTTTESSPLTTTLTTTTAKSTDISETKSETFETTTVSKTEKTQEVTTAPVIESISHTTSAPAPTQTLPVTTVSVTDDTSKLTTATTTTVVTTTEQTTTEEKPVFPDYTVEFELGETSGYAGDVVYINFGICKNDNNGFCSFLSELEYDTSVLTFEEVSMLPILDSSRYAIACYAPSNCFTFNSSSYQNVLLDSIDILTLKFRINKNAPAGDYNINIVNDDSETRIITRYNTDDGSVLVNPDVIFHPGVITVKKDQPAESVTTPSEESQVPQQTSPVTDNNISETSESVATSPAPKAKYKFKKIF